MVVPLTSGDLQRMVRISKKDDGSLGEEAFHNFSFVPMLKGRSQMQDTDIGKLYFGF